MDLLSIAEGEFPEILGVVVLALEHDEDFDSIRDKINDEIPKLEEKLKMEIENGQLIDKLLDKLEPGSSDDDNPGNDDSNQCTNFEDVLKDLPSGDFSVLKEIFGVSGQIK